MPIRNPHILQANHKNETPTRIIYFDSEARVTDPGEDYKAAALAGEVITQHDPFLVVACFVTGKKEKWEMFHGEQFAERFWAAVDKFTPKNKRTTMFAHNAKYDILATGGIKYLLALGYTLVSFSEDLPLILRFAKKTPEGKTLKTVLILSSTNYYMASLAALGKTFDLPKMEAAYNAGLDDAIVYCRRDVEILKKAMEGFIQFVQDDDLGNFSLTLAGQSFAAFRHRFMTTGIFIHDRPEVLTLEREAYSGGRTEAWFLGDIPHEVFYLDVNSMYPYVMRENLFPTRLLTYRRRGTVDQLSGFIRQGYLLVAKVFVDTDRPIFFKKGDRLLFPVGRFWTTLTTPEIERGIALGIIQRVAEYAIYDGANIFSQFVDHFYSMRRAAKERGDEVRSYLYKLMLNSLYGKFGQAAIPFERLGDANPEETRTERVITLAPDGSRRVDFIKIFGGSVFRKLEFAPGENEAYNSFTGIAAHVTAYARLLLWDYITAAGPENVYYMDTDSIFANRAGYDRLLAAGAVDPAILGKLKLEQSGAVTIKGLKDYVFAGKIKLKGVSKNAVAVDEKTYIMTRWTGISTAIREGNLEGYRNRSMVKRLSRSYDKGTRTESGKVIPIRLDERG